MPAFHASLASTGQAIGKVAIMPLKQTSKGCPRGPAPVTEEDEDIVDQTINLFKVQRISSLLVQHVGVTAAAAERHLLPSHMSCHQANILFTSFDMETDVDRVLVYLTFYIVECLRKLQKEPSLERGTAAMHSLARENFALPGDAGFPKSLNVFCTKPSRSEAEEMKKYFTQVGT